MAPTRDQAITPSWATLSLGCQACSVEANLHWRRQVMRNAMWVKENLHWRRGRKIQPKRPRPDCSTIQ
jgi:hypothetical protein